MSIPEDEAKNLVVMMTELSSKLQILLDKQEELAEGITKIKEAVYNPDSGLYARLRGLEIRITSVEQWKASNTRIMWIVGTTVIGMSIATMWNMIF